MRFLARWRLAGQLQRQANAGFVLIPVPCELAADIRQDLWHRATERAAGKWAARAAEVSLPQWQAATQRVSKVQAEQHWSDAYGRAGQSHGRQAD